MGEGRLEEGRPIEPALLVRSTCDRTYAPARFLPTEREDKRPEWVKGDIHKMRSRVPIMLLFEQHDRHSGRRTDDDAASPADAKVSADVTLIQNKLPPMKLLEIIMLVLPSPVVLLSSYFMRRPDKAVL